MSTSPLVKSIGIEDISVYSPAYYVDMLDFADARNISRDKLVKGLFLESMSVPASDEDAVSMAANAVAPLLDEQNVEDIGMIVTGTESGVDYAKSISNYLQGIFGLRGNIRSYEAKQACVGGTHGLLSVVEWIASGNNRCKKALVICTDIARYAIGGSGEPTQGAGAVAMIISENPKVLEMEYTTVGEYSEESCASGRKDFFRPNTSDVAIVDGSYSEEVYLRAVPEAFMDHARKHYELYANDRPEPLFNFDYLLFHLPYGKMVKKAFFALQKEIDLQTLENNPQNDPQKTFEKMSLPSIALGKKMGNIYTGSLYLSLLSLLYSEGDDAVDRRTGMFSFGSGCGAVFYAGTIRSTPYARIESIRQALDKRMKISVKEYEDLREGRTFMHAPTGLRLIGVDDDGFRRYGA